MTSLRARGQAARSQVKWRAWVGAVRPAIVSALRDQGMGVTWFAVHDRNAPAWRQGLACALTLAAGAAQAANARPARGDRLFEPGREATPPRPGPWKTGSPYLYVPLRRRRVWTVASRACAWVRRRSARRCFRSPFFASSDRGCARDLGSSSRDPDLANGSVRLRDSNPVARACRPTRSPRPDEKTGGYASMILFRKDLGPPPGLLLMNRRRTLGTRLPQRDPQDLLQPGLRAGRGRAGAAALFQSGRRVSGRGLRGAELPLCQLPIGWSCSRLRT